MLLFPEAESDLDKLDRSVEVRIREWMTVTLEGAQDPYRNARPLKGRYKASIVTMSAITGYA